MQQDIYDVAIPSTSCRDGTQGFTALYVQLLWVSLGSNSVANFNTELFQTINNEGNTVTLTLIFNFPPFQVQNIKQINSQATYTE